jgi:hypothetical protein
MYKAFFFDRRVVEYIDSFYDHKNKRCVLKTPYAKQFIMVAQLGKVIIAAVCANFDTKLMQIELYGFTVDKSEKKCEVLHIFNNSGSAGSGIIQKLGDIVLEKIKNDGYTKIYSTCSNFRVKQYEIMGFKIEQINETDNEKTYLMSMDI